MFPDASAQVILALGDAQGFGFGQRGQLFHLPFLVDHLDSGGLSGDGIHGHDNPTPIPGHAATIAPAQPVARVENSLVFMEGRDETSARKSGSLWHLAMSSGSNEPMWFFKNRLAAIKATCSKTWEGGGFSATNINFRWSMIRSTMRCSEPRSFFARWVS